VVDPRGDPGRDGVSGPDVGSYEPYVHQSSPVDVDVSYAWDDHNLLSESSASSGDA